MDPKFVTSYQADWPIQNLSALKVALLNAYLETNILCNPARSVVFSTPNQHMHTGYTRWIAVSQKLEESCKSGRLHGITAEWSRVTKNSGFWVLELRGKLTRLIVCHISDLDNSPRDSVSRFDGRASNQVLMNFEEEAITEQSPLLTLTLVHGHKNAEFAFIRGYNDPKRPSSYELLSGNVMDLPTVALPVEEEEIEPPEIDIEDHFRADGEEEEGNKSS